MKAGDRVRDVSGMRGTVLRVEHVPPTGSGVTEQVFVRWDEPGTVAELEPNPEATP